MTPPFVCSVVLTWNNYADTRECLDALLHLTYQRHAIVLADNGSEDGSAARLVAESEGAIDYVRWETNRGCGAGYNLGITRALELGADYVFIVDNDIIVRRAVVEELLAAHGDRADVALVAPVIVRHDDPERVWFARGRYARLLGITRHEAIGRRVESLSGLIGRTYETDYAPTCAVLIKRAALERIGHMDDRFFFGHDDIDWCLRARAAGMRNLVVGKVLATHKVSTTGGERGSTAFTPFSAYHHARGSVLMGRKHARGFRMVPYALGQVGVRLPYYSAQMLLARRPAGVAAYVRGLIDGFREYVWPARAPGPRPR